MKYCRICKTNGIVDEDVRGRFTDNHYKFYLLPALWRGKREKNVRSITDYNKIGKSDIILYGQFNFITMAYRWKYQ